MFLSRSFFLLDAIIKDMHATLFAPEPIPPIDCAIYETSKNERVSYIYGRHASEYCCNVRQIIPIKIAFSRPIKFKHLPIEIVVMIKNTALILQNEST